MRRAILVCALMSPLVIGGCASGPDAAPAAVLAAETLLASLPPLGPGGATMTVEAANAAGSAIAVATEGVVDAAVRAAAADAAQAIAAWRRAESMPTATLARDAVRRLAIAYLASASGSAP